MKFASPEQITFEMPGESRVRGTFPIVTRDRKPAPPQLVEKLARVGLAFDRYGRIVVSKPDQEVQIAEHD